MNGSAKSLVMAPVKKQYPKNLENYLTGSNVPINPVTTLNGTFPSEAICMYLEMYGLKIGDAPFILPSHYYI